MNAFTNYLEKLGSNFLVAAMVPALALILAGMLVFDPILHIGSIFKDAQSTVSLVGLGTIVSVLTIIVGFTLTALNTFILKMFEGYVIPFPMRFLYSLRKRSHQHRAHQLMDRCQRLENEIRELEKRLANRPDLREEIEQLKDEHYRIAGDYDLMYPQDLGDILPTRFGNTLKAAENYSGERYGFDGVHFWPRLVYVIPAEYRVSIDAVRNELSFLVNMSMLSAVFALLCIPAIFYSMWEINTVQLGPSAYLQFLKQVWPYFVAMTVGLISSVFFYNASLFSVGSFGLVIRSSYDLFRLDLLKKLGLERPKDSTEEHSIWYKLNELIVLGNHSLTYEELHYREKE